MNLALPRDLHVDERRVALVPRAVAELSRAGLELAVEPGAGSAAGYADREYEAAGGRLAKDRGELLDRCDVVLALHPPGPEDMRYLTGRSTLVGLLEPLSHSHGVREIAATGATSFALELLPRTTRAQSMDVLSSMATVAGYKAALVAAVELTKMYPMLITAAGTLAPAQVFVIGAGVAGLQAIATSRRLGGVVTAYDVRPDVREQVESLGARFVALELETAGAEDVGGYAKNMGDDFYQRQRELMAETVAKSDVVISTAAVPGSRAPVLVTSGMVAAMRCGSVIVDLAAESGGNCEATVAGETRSVHGVTIVGATNLPATVPRHASQMLARGFTAFVEHLIVEGEIDLDRDDDIVQSTLLTRDGEIVHGRVAELADATRERD